MSNDNATPSKMENKHINLQQNNAQQQSKQEQERNKFENEGIEKKMLEKERLEQQPIENEEMQLQLQQLQQLQQQQVKATEKPSSLEISSKNKTLESDHRQPTHPITKINPPIIDPSNIEPQSIISPLIQDLNIQQKITDIHAHNNGNNNAPQPIKDDSINKPTEPQTHIDTEQDYNTASLLNTSTILAPTPLPGAKAPPASAPLPGTTDNNAQRGKWILGSKARRKRSTIEHNVHVETFELRDEQKEKMDNPDFIRNLRNNFTIFGSFTYDAINRTFGIVLTAQKLRKTAFIFLERSLGPIDTNKLQINDNDQKLTYIENVDDSSVPRVSFGSSKGDQKRFLLTDMQLEALSSPQFMQQIVQDFTHFGTLNVHEDELILDSYKTSRTIATCQKLERRIGALWTVEEVVQCMRDTRTFGIPN